MTKMTLKSQEGLRLWEKAKELIPGGNQLLSKRPEMFAPEQWPAYYKKAKGADVWDLDGNHYCDMGIMGMACVLGYANSEVNHAVIQAIESGNMCSLNCEEEVVLAEKLVELHPWASSVRFARTGGEACAIAVRIARAFTKKDKIAFCGYHGWSDWYLSANIANAENLDKQLLSGLSPAGVPKGLKDTAVPFLYGDFESFQSTIKGNMNEIGVIIMEVGRNHVDVDFLRKIKDLAGKIGAVLIFDEITSGFRLRAGGMHMLYDVEPDMVVLGKAMGNGYPIAAVVGRENVMSAAQETFISSSYWTEKIGFVAALEVIRQFQENNVAAKINSLGATLKKGMNAICKAHDLKITMEGLDAAPVFKIQEESALVIKTLYVQEMMKRGFLVAGLFYVSFAHTPEIIDRYLHVADEVLGAIAEAKRSHQLSEMLEGPVCHAGFQRLT